MIIRDSINVHRNIREQDPLKRGLKLHSAVFDSYVFRIREQDPLKQGLKPTSYNFNKAGNLYSRARSTKTRIETQLPLCQSGCLCDSRARSTKTRIETEAEVSIDDSIKVFASKIH